MPAREAKVGLVDRIYARVGASDNIARGQSTFMVEMQETAHILNGATSRSLVVLDEIGRGTATFDGLSIAWAVAEHLAKNPRARPKTLFATHYHELTDLADALPGVVNAHVTAREWKDEIVFLHKILPGRSDRSYGIQVARLAGLPPSVIARARDILGSLEHDELSRGGRPALSGAPAARSSSSGCSRRLPKPTMRCASGCARSISIAPRRSKRCRSVGLEARRRMGKHVVSVGCSRPSGLVLCCSACTSGLRQIPMSSHLPSLPRPITSIRAWAPMRCRRRFTNSSSTTC